MKKTILLLGALAIISGCKKKKEETKTPPAEQGGATAGGAPATGDTTAAAGGTAAPAVDYNAGQSTGAQTEDVASTTEDKYRNTLVDREIGVAVTCPPDKTWKCSLGPDKKFLIQDMSSNNFVVRAGIGKDAAEALQNEIAYVGTILPDVKEASKEGTTAVLDIGPDPDWATPVARKAYVEVKEVGGKLFVCRGWGSVTNWENDSPDFKALCDSLAAPPAAK